MTRPTRDLVVLSHLRWDGVWQRPHHLVSRLAPSYRRTRFVEEPLPRSSGGVSVRCETDGPVQRVIIDVPNSAGPATFGETAEFDHADLVHEACGGLVDPVVWLYTPMALPIAQRLRPAVLVYDVMDDLASFRGAPAQMRLRHVQALAEADLVFTGGRSIHERVVEHRRRPAHTVCLPSGVAKEDFAHPRLAESAPVAGYVGVIDERIDLALIAELAVRLPHWRIRMVGPVAKIDEATLPVAPNIEYWGKRPYVDLPRILAGFDVALMPFALNEATASISPTKTLEYLAAGLPTVSTPIRDVVRDHGSVVTLADDAAGFARACDEVLAGRVRLPHAAVQRVLDTNHWDVIAGRMQDLIESSSASSNASDRAAGGNRATA